MTPSLNKSFKFQSDWPYNSSQAYIMSSILKDLEDDDNAVFSGMSQSAILNALQDVQDTTSGTFRNSLSALTKETMQL